MIRSSSGRWLVRLWVVSLLAFGCAGTLEPTRATPAERTAAPESVGLSRVGLERLDAVLDGYVARGELPGYQLLVARRGEVVHETVRGMLEVETARPLRPDSIYRIYSMSKLITGVATMIAYEQNGFLLNERLGKYLPAFEEMTRLEPREDGRFEVVRAENPVTILDLLRHTSGLAYTFTAPPDLREQYLAASITPGLRGAPPEGGPLGPSGTDTEATLADMVERLGTLPLIAEPGTRWHYGVNMDVLGRLIEVVSGETYPEYLRRHLFEPLGMNDTAFHVDDSRIDRFAASYVPSEDGGLKLLDAPGTSDFREPPAMPGGGGGLVSTAHDYMRFGLMLANRGELDGVRILSPRTVDFMMANHLPPEIFGRQPLHQLFDGHYANGALGVGFGLTGSVIEEPALTGLPVSRGTFGWGGAASTFFWVDPEEEIVVVFMTQLLPSSHYPLRGHLMKGVNAAILAE